MHSNELKENNFKKGMSVKEFAEIYPGFESNTYYWEKFRPPIWEKVIQQKIDDTVCDIFLRFDENKILYEVNFNYAMPLISYLVI